MNIQLSYEAVPIQKPVMHVPISLKDKFEQEIHSMEKQGIISKLDHNQATEWLNSSVVVKKPNGDLRICLDPTNLNTYIARPICNLNTFDEMSFKLKDAKFDATKGFFHLPLNEKSKLLTAMLTPLGVYVFNVLAMGLSNSNDLFESALRELLQGLKGMVNIADDVFVFGSTQQEHNSNVITLLGRCLKVDLKLNLCKIRINCSKVPFFGQCTSAEGIKPDPSKVMVIKDWPILSNVKELQSFLGSVHYLSHFVPELTSLRTPLQPLVKTNTDFIQLQSC